MRPTTTPFLEHVVVVVAPLARWTRHLRALEDQRRHWFTPPKWGVVSFFQVASSGTAPLSPSWEAGLLISPSIPSPVLLGLALAPNLKGQQPSCPFPVRELMALSRSLHETPREREGRPSFWERPSHALPDREEPAARTMLVGQGWLAVSNDWSLARADAAQRIQRSAGRWARIIPALSRIIISMKPTNTAATGRPNMTASTHSRRLPNWL